MMRRAPVYTLYSVELWSRGKVWGRESPLTLAIGAVTHIAFFS